MTEYILGQLWQNCPELKLHMSKTTKSKSSLYKWLNGVKCSSTEENRSQFYR